MTLKIGFITLLILMTGSISVFAQVQVEIFTGNVDGAGTDSNIDLTIGGKTVRLNPLVSGNAFETGHSDSVIWPEAFPKDGAGFIRITSDNSGLGSDWFMERIVLRGTGKPAVYSCYCWIKTGSLTKTLEQDEAGAVFSPDLQAYPGRASSFGRPRDSKFATFSRDSDIQMGVLRPDNIWVIPGWNQTAEEVWPGVLKFSNGEIWAAAVLHSAQNVVGVWTITTANGQTLPKPATINAVSDSGVTINNTNLTDHGISRFVTVIGDRISDRDRRVMGTHKGGVIKWSDGAVWRTQDASNYQWGATRMPSPGALDIDAKNDSVWIIGTTAAPGGYEILHLVNATEQWAAVDGAAIRIAVDPAGDPWIVNSSGIIYKRKDNAWSVVPGPGPDKIVDIAITTAGEVWVVTDGGLVSKMNGNAWSAGLALGAKQIIAFPKNALQIVDANGRRSTRESATSWVLAPDISDLADRYVEFAVDGATKWAVDAARQVWRLK